MGFVLSFRKNVTDACQQSSQWLSFK